MSTKGWRKQFCKWGHDTFATGRDNFNGCRACRNRPEVKARDKAYARTKYAADPEIWRKGARERRSWMAEIKVQMGCKDCGFNKYPEALEFDHLPGQDKKDTVSNLVGRNSPKEKIFAEMAKCDLVCSNCHHHRTWLRKQLARSLREGK